MKHLKLFLAALLLSGIAVAQSSSSGGNAGLTPYTVATLPTGKSRGTFATVSDGSTASDCTVGGGTTAVACIYTGSAWAFAGSSASAPAFSAIGSGTNTGAAMTVGSGSSLATSGTGTISSISAISAQNLVSGPINPTVSIPSSALVASSGANLSTTISGTASTTTSINVASITDFAVNQGVCIVGAGATGTQHCPGSSTSDCVSKITAVATGNLTISPACSSAPTTAGKGVYHDDGAALQAAVSTATISTEAKILLPSGVFNVNTACQTSNAATSMILVPTINTATFVDTPFAVVDIEGLTPALNLDNGAAQGGTVIQTASTGCDLIAGAGSSTGGNSGYTAVKLIVNGIAFRRTVNPIYSAINAVAIGQLSMPGFNSCDVGSVPVAVPTAGGVCVIAPGAGNPDLIDIGTLRADGFTTALTLVEHAAVQHLICGYDEVCVVINNPTGSGISPGMNIGQLNYEQTQYGIDVIGGSSNVLTALTVNMMASEHDAGTFAIVDDVYDVGNRLYGTAAWSYNGSAATYTANGAANFFVDNLVTHAFSIGGAATAGTSVAAPLFNDSGLTASLPICTDASKNLSSVCTALVTVADINASGTPSSTTFLRGDGTWNAPSGSGTVTSSGPPTANQFPYFTTGTNLAALTVPAGSLFVPSPTVGAAPIAQTKPIFDIRDCTVALCGTVPVATADFALALSTLMGNLGPGYIIDTRNPGAFASTGSTYCLGGGSQQQCVFSDSDISAGLGSGFEETIYWGNYWIVTSAPWTTPAGARQWIGVTSGASKGPVGTWLIVCYSPQTPAATCGPSAYTQYPTTTTRAVGGPFLDASPYSTGTISVAAGNNPIVTGSGTTFTSGMVGGYLTSCATSSSLTATCPNATNACSALITGFTSTTSITISGNWGTEGNNPGVVCPTATAGLVYKIYHPTAIPVLSWAGQITNDSYQTNSFGSVLQDFGVDLEGLPLGIGILYNGTQERDRYFANHVVLNSGNWNNGGSAGCNPGSAGCTGETATAAISACGMWDRTFNFTGEAGPAHYQFYTGDCTTGPSYIASAANTEGYPWVLEAYDIIRGNLGDSGNNPFDQGTVTGKAIGTFQAFHDCGFYDGFLRLHVMNPHCEFDNNGIEVGSLNGGNGVIIQNVSTANMAGAANTAAVHFYSGQTGSHVYNASVIANSTKIVQDDGTAGQTITSSASGCPASGCTVGEYDQPTAFDGTIGAWNANSLNLNGSTSGTFAVTINSTASTLSLGSNASLTSAGALTVVSCSGCGSGGPGTGTQYAPAYWATTSTLGSTTPPTTPNGVPQFMVSTPSGGAATAPVLQLAGVPIDATNPATLLATDRFNFLSWTSGTALALPSLASSGFTNNDGFALRNTEGATITLTPNAGHSDLCDGASTCTILNNFASFVYSDAATNWDRIYFPTFAAFPGCTGVMQFSTTTGFSCNTAPTLTGTNFTGIPNGALTNSATTVNGQTCTLGSTCAVESATSGQMAVSGGSGAALTGAADLTYATHTFSGTANTIFDLSAATGTAAFKVPQTTTNTASAAGVIDFDTTNKNFHGYVNGADSIFANFASAPTTNVIPKAVIASGNTLLANSLLTDTGTTATYTGTGGLAAPVFTATGTTAGFADFPQGTTSAAVAPCNTATSICLMAPTSVTSQLRVFAGAPATGFPLYTNSSGTMTETISATSGTLSSGVGVLGTLAVNAVLASTVANAAGHFTNLQVVTSLGGTCTTVPIFNVFDGTSNVGSTVTAGSTTQTKGTGTSTAQTLTFAAGDIIGIYISTAGATCTLDQFIVSAQYSIP
jgi:hypothetical protein